MEYVFRSLNNLLERFHHAYWFYFMPTAHSFIPISKYIPPLIIIIVCVILGSLNLWIQTGDIEIPKLKNLKREPWKYLQREVGSLSFTNRHRPLYLPLVTLASSFAFCAYCFSHMGTISAVAHSSFQNVLLSNQAMYMFSSIIVGQQTTTWFMIPLIQRLITGESGSSTITVAGSWKILKCFVCAIMGMVLMSLTTINPSLSLFFAIPLVPITLLFRPTKSNVLFVIQMSILVLLSPPMLLALYGLYVQNYYAATLFLTEAFEYWSVFGGFFLPMMCLFYWPLNIACQVCIGMEL